MFGLQQPTGRLKDQVCSLAYELAATWRWPTLAQKNHSELSHMAGAVDDSTINIVVVIIIIINRMTKRNCIQITTTVHLLCLFWCVSCFYCLPHCRANKVWYEMEYGFHLPVNAAIVVVVSQTDVGRRCKQGAFIQVMPRCDNRRTMPRTR